MTTLYREIDALGGAVEDAWGEGYAEALSDVLAILIRRGHSEHCDPTLDALALMVGEYLPSDYDSSCRIAAQDAARRAIEQAGGQA